MLPREFLQTAPDTAELRRRAQLLRHSAEIVEDTARLLQYVTLAQHYERICEVAESHSTVLKDPLLREHTTVAN